MIERTDELTERKKAEERLRESEERFRGAFESAAIGMALVALDGRWLRVNRSLCEMVGYPEHELLVRTFQEITHPDDLEADLALVRRLLSREIPYYHLEKRYMHKDGHTIWIMLSASLVDDMHGNPMYFVAQVENITQRRLAEEEFMKLNEHLCSLNEGLERKVEERTGELLEVQEKLARNEKLAVLGRLAGSVGHELRNPLGVMNNAVYFLKLVLAEGDETVKEYLEIIKHEIDNSQRIITDLLDFSRTKPPQAREMPVRELVDDCLRKCDIPENVALHTDLPDSLPAVKVDPLQMGQVFQNLLTNAVQAMPEGGSLRIGARKVRGTVSEERAAGNEDLEKTTAHREPNDDLIEITVADTGVGISPENMKQLFQPLFTTKAKGIGLGLVVCRNLTTANGGGIEVESEPGKGTTFTVRLPASGRGL